MSLHLVASNSDSIFWLGGGLVPNKVHSGSVMTFVPLSSPSTCGVSFHYNDGVLSFGVDVVKFSSTLK